MPFIPRQVFADDQVIDYWLKVRYWRAKEFACLYCGINPLRYELEEQLPILRTGESKKIPMDVSRNIEDILTLIGHRLPVEHSIYGTPRQWCSRLSDLGLEAPGWMSRINANTDADDQAPPPSTNKTIKKSKAPTVFQNALVRLLEEIEQRASDKGLKFDRQMMPGKKADLFAIAYKYDEALEKSVDTFSDYLKGICKFKRGARKSHFYNDLFPEYL